MLRHQQIGNTLAGLEVPSCRKLRSLNLCGLQKRSLQSGEELWFIENAFEKNITQENSRSDYFETVNDVCIQIK